MRQPLTSQTGVGETGGLRLVRVAPVFAAALMVGSIAMVTAGAPTAEEPRFLLLAEQAALYGDLFNVEPAPEGLSPVEAKDYWLEQRDVLGRPIQDWLDHVQATYSFDTRPGASADSGVDLVEATLALDAVLGLAVTPLQITEMQAQSAALDPEVRDAFADLVFAVAQAYAAQAPVAAELTATFPTQFDATKAFLAPAVRDEMDARAAGIVAAMNEFRDRTAGLIPVSTHAVCDPLFTDPEGAVILGNTCDSTYTRSGTLPDPVLVVDAGGNDLYLNSAGGADPAGLLTPGTFNRLALSAVLDVDGDDTYTYTGLPATVQGAGGIGAIGILVDAQGNDLYFAKMTRTTTISTLTGVQYYFDGGGQGYGFGGVGVLLDGTGNDVYDFQVASVNGRHIWAFAQGFGAAGGLGLSSDLLGWDAWLSKGLGITGNGNHFQGLYTQGAGFYSGVGIMTDSGLGNDIYHNYDNSTTTDYYAQGFGAFAGLGVLADDGGNDEYIAVEKATNPWISPLLNCAYGTASLGGYGVMIEGGGDDSYYGDTISPRRAHTMNEGFGGIGAGVGLFFDLGGVDSHVMEAHGTQGSILSGRGVIEPDQIFNNVGLGEGANVIGFYLDLGGEDHYEGPGEDDAVWAFGADVNGV